MILKPWLWIPSNWGHNLGPLFFKLRGRFFSYKTFPWRSFTWKQLEFTNPLGLAGGFDKNAELIHGLWSLGAGFLEIGTVTPFPQKPNPGKIINRFPEQKALWNQMGFPSQGADALIQKLKKFRYPHFTPIFINIGKNRTTPLEKASQDYILLIQKLSPYADAFVVNVSSPNTPNLRDLLKPQYLKEFLTPILQENQKNLNKPILLKLPPDISHEELYGILDTSAAIGIQGWVLTNTTLAREPNSPFPKTGGVSGKPLAQASRTLLQKTVAHLGDRRKDFLIVSSGGVLSPQEVFERLQMGANLVQVYSALVFEGPFFFKKVYEAST